MWVLAKSTTAPFFLFAWLSSPFFQLYTVVEQDFFRSALLKNMLAEVCQYEALRLEGGYAIHAVLLPSFQCWKCTLRTVRSACSWSYSKGGISDSVFSDTASFGSLQTLPSFLRQFGDAQPDGTYKLSTTRKSIMNSGNTGMLILMCIDAD